MDASLGSLFGKFLPRPPPFLNLVFDVMVLNLMTYQHWIILLFSLAGKENVIIPISVILYNIFKNTIESLKINSV